MRFERAQHVVIARALASMDAPFLERARCYFGGGTLIVLQNGEYRMSLDVDFMCADRDGYRELRVAAVERGAGAFFGADVGMLRPFTADQYGIRGLLSLHGQPIRFEIVREGRIALDGSIDVDLGVPVLSVSDQFAEKLLANADRGLDRSVGYRDAVDLRVGPAPWRAAADGHRKGRRCVWRRHRAKGRRSAPRVEVPGRTRLRNRHVGDAPGSPGRCSGEPSNRRRRIVAGP